MSDDTERVERPNSLDRVGAADPDQTLPKRGAFMGDDDLLRAFENCSLPYAEWTHRCHVKVAYLYLRRFPYEGALARIRNGIQRYNAAQSIVESPTTGYNETTTVAFSRLIAAAIETCRPAGHLLTADQFCDAHPQLMTSRALRSFYSPALRADPRTKLQFVEPDLAPLPARRLAGNSREVPGEGDFTPQAEPS